MSNYPDDIAQHSNNPNSPTYDGPDLDEEIAEVAANIISDECERLAEYMIDNCGNAYFDLIVSVASFLEAGEQSAHKGHAINAICTGLQNDINHELERIISAYEKLNPLAQHYIDTAADKMASERILN